MLLVKNDLISKLGNYIMQEPIDWDYIGKISNKRIKKKDKRDINSLQGFFFELHVNNVIDSFAKKHMPRVKLDPIGTERVGKFDYYFSTRDWRALKNVEVRNENNTYCEYDRVVILDEIPTIVECKMKKWKKNKGQRIRECFGIKKILHNIKPMIDYFERKPGYIITTILEGLDCDSEYINDFYENNGIFAGVDISRQEFRIEALSCLYKN